MKKHTAARLLTTAAVGALLTVYGPFAARAAEDGVKVNGTTLEIIASAEASATPDTATISAGVITQAQSAVTAMRENAKKMAAVFAAVKKLEIDEKDIQTASISVTPRYEYKSSSFSSASGPPRLSGYQASNTITVKLRGARTGEIGPVLDALAAAGVNRLNGPDFGLDDSDALIDKARAAAVAKAQKRAALYAAATGLHLGRLVSLSEEGRSAGPPRPMMIMAAKGSSAVMSAPDTQVAPGVVEAGITLDVKYELSN